MPPQQPSRSCRAMIHSAQRRNAAVRTAVTGRSCDACRSNPCSTRSSPVNIRPQASAARGRPIPVARPFAARGTRTPPESSSSSPNDSGRTGRSEQTTVSGTMVWRAQQPQS